MNKKPTVSIIIPVYNGARYVRDAIESVLNQTFKDYEIILIDDGSVDNTREVIQDYIESSRIKYIYQENKGLGAARNAGIRNASGKYLKFLDCDDVLYSQQLELQVKYLKDKSEIVVSATNYEMEFESGAKTLITVNFGKTSQLARYIAGSPTPVHTVLIHREIVNRVGGFDEELTSCEDRDFWLRILLIGCVIERIEYCGCRYRILNGSLSSNPDKQFQQRCKVFEKLNQALLPKLDRLSKDVLSQLQVTNTKLIHMCFAKNFDPSSYIPVTLKVGGLILELHANGIKKFLLRVIGASNLFLLKFWKLSWQIPNYRAGLLNITSWREEPVSLQKSATMASDAAISNEFKYPLISIIIPVFNGAQYIRDAIESVLNQSFRNFEIIVVDDGSTDKTRAIVGPWIKNGIIHYIYQDNKGAAVARNAGIRLARGRYLKFLDYDDLLYPQQLELQVLHLKEKPETVISVTDFELEFKSKNRKAIKVFLGDDSQLARFILSNIGPIHGILVHRNIIEKVGGFDEGLLSCQDTDLWLRILLRGGVFERLDYVGCCYRLLEGSVSSNSDRHFRQRCRVFEKLNQALLPQLNQLKEDVLQQLLKSNTKLIHTCFARRIKPSSCLKTTLQITALIYAVKIGEPRKTLSKLIGIQNIVLLKYLKVCREDPTYYASLLNSAAWRDERNYG